MRSSLVEIYNLFLECDHISIDSRNIVKLSDNKSRVLFFALKGDNFDGNKFIDKAIEFGAWYCISDDDSYLDSLNVIVVDNVLTSLQELAAFHRRKLDAKIISITGSNGKTTSKELLNAVLSKKYKVTCTVGNLNNHIGVPLTLLSIPLDCEIAIIEMGANHHQEIKCLCKIAKPDFGVITNIGKAHLEGFGSQEGVAKAKGELFEYLSKNSGEIFYDKSCSWLVDIVKGLSVNYSLLHPYETMSVQVKSSCKGELILNYDSVLYQTQLIGDYNKFNIVLAINLGQYFSVCEEDIKKAIENYVPNNQRSQLIDVGSNHIILDAYNANPSSMESSLNNFDNLIISNKMVILGDMKELGSHTEREHIAIVALVKEMSLSRVVFVGNYFRKAMENVDIIADWYESVDYLIKSLVDCPVKNTAILIKGSNSMNLDTVVKFLN